MVEKAVRPSCGRSGQRSTVTEDGGYSSITQSPPNASSTTKAIFWLSGLSSRRMGRMLHK
ncbi:hypothetical protein [Pseudonocardia spinosispora]|uniref:hypothetical protein n=1 Tax=Pseudonocardia spinosispora TaxID=103441 RepID=UPI000685A081|nr:hypothetical protein [Pseudonocardia spinosispora]